jgi:hypothetical protein
MNIAVGFVVVALACVALSTALMLWPSHPRGGWRRLNLGTIGGPSLLERVRRYRSGGHAADGIHMLRSYQIDDLDYQLMGADNSCARIAFGPEASTGEWFAINPRSDLAREHFGNSHGTSYDGGKTFLTESAYMEVPRADCRVPTEEVVWHHLRVTELRKQGVEQPKRVEMMTAERASKPWATASLT